MNRWTLAATCAAALALAACSSPNPDTTTSKATPPAASTAPADNPSTAPRTMASMINETLQAYYWTLDKAEDSAGRAQPNFKALEPKVPVRLDFLAGSKPGEQWVTSRVCNTMTGGYALQGNTIEVSRLMSTQMGCMDQNLVRLEQAVGAQMGRMQSVQIMQDGTAPRMTLQFNDGSRWHMKGHPTDATRYGSAGETMFLEVAPQTRPCVSGVMRTQCLQVREVRYDSAGLKTGTGEWHAFHGEIQGFKHEAGLRHVLRIKRYPVKNPAADASAFAYVMDARIEVERVSKSQPRRKAQ